MLNFADIIVLCGDKIMLKIMQSSESWQGIWFTSCVFK